MTLLPLQAEFEFEIWSGARDLLTVPNQTLIRPDVRLLEVFKSTSNAVPYRVQI